VVNTDPYGKGWMILVQPDNEGDGQLMPVDKYLALDWEKA